MPANVPTPRRILVHVAAALHHAAAHGQPRRDPAARVKVRPPRRRRRSRRGDRYPSHPDARAGSDQQRAVPLQRRIPLKPTLALEALRVREHGGATPAHRATPRLARSRPDPRQPRKPLNRPLTRTPPAATRRPRTTRRLLGHRPPQKPRAATITPAPPSRVVSPVVAVDFEVDF